MCLSIGKTTALAEVAERLRSRGFGVFVVPEAATLMFTGGASIARATDAHTLNFQTQLMRTQIVLEDSFIQLARTSNQRETFVLCDRGTCDGRAYMSPELWSRMLEKNNWNMVDIRDARYDLVVHLATAADGAPEFYTLANNRARSESPELARCVDRRTQSAWVGHPHLRIVDNRTGFREKINRVDACISELAGLDLVRRVVRKFLLRDFPEENGSRKADVQAEVEHFNVEQTFLQTGLVGDVQESVRRRGKNGVFTYVHKVRRGDSETKRQITSREYTSLMAHRDPARGTARIKRQCFLHAGTYFVVDRVMNIKPKLCMLRSHCEVGDDVLKIPDWLNVDKEITKEKEYSMHSITTRVLKDEKYSSVK